MTLPVLSDGDIFTAAHYNEIRNRLEAVDGGTANGLIVNVKHYGATGNGTTDDTASIQSAINAAGSGVVYFPLGVYKITSGLTMSATAVTLRGAAWVGGTCSIKAGGSMSQMLTHSALRGNIYDLEFDGNNLATNCILLKNAAVGCLTRVSVHAALQDGIQFNHGGGENNNQVVIRDCQSYLNGRYGIGIPTFQSDNNALLLQSNWVNNNGSHGMLLKGTNITVAYGNIEANAGYAIYVSNAADSLFSIDNAFFYVYTESNASGGIYFDSKAVRCTVYQPSGVQGVTGTGVHGNIWVTAQNDATGLYDLNTADGGVVRLGGGVVRFLPGGSTKFGIIRGPDAGYLTADRAFKFPDVDGTVGLKTTPPATAASAGVDGQWAEDDSFLYVCVAPNTWKRVAIATW